jgi:hypothetical protein
MTYAWANRIGNDEEVDGEEAQGMRREKRVAGLLFRVV